MRQMLDPVHAQVKQFQASLPSQTVCGHACQDFGVGKVPVSFREEVDGTFGEVRQIGFDIALFYNPLPKWVSCV